MDLKTNMKSLFEGCWTIPNLLSLIRILLIPVFAVLFVKGYVLEACIVITVAALTDLFDGKIARKYNQISALGKILDPIADKLSQMAIVIVLIITYKDDSIKYLFAFFIAKEVVMLIGGAILLAKVLRPTAAEMWGKVATTVFYVVMIVIICFGQNGALVEFTGIQLNTIATWVLVGISAVATLCSLLGYIPGFVKQIKEGKEQKDNA